MKASEVTHHTRNPPSQIPDREAFIVDCVPRGNRYNHSRHVTQRGGDHWFEIRPSLWKRAPGSIRSCPPNCPFHPYRRGSAGLARSGPASSCSALRSAAASSCSARRLRALRTVAVLGHVGCSVPADHLQPRADALHAGDGRAGVHRLHAHASDVDLLGLVLRRSCTSCRWAGRRGPVRQPARFSFSSPGAWPARRRRPVYSSVSARFCFAS